jgi:hypothetical protein
MEEVFYKIFSMIIEKIKNHLTPSLTKTKKNAIGESLILGLEKP